MEIPKTKVTLLIDNPNSWVVDYVEFITEELSKEGCDVNYVNDLNSLSRGDIAIFLSFEAIVKKEKRDLNKHNLVIHESALPEGKGWSPLTWQILEGKDKIAVTLFEARESVDSGEIYEQDVMEFDGTELVDDLRRVQAEKTVELIIRFIRKYKEGTLNPKKQVGKETFYRKRKPEDSELDVNRSIAEQFNLFRVADNERYPLFLYYRGHKYVLKFFAEGG